MNPILCSCRMLYDLHTVTSPFVIILKKKILAHQDRIFIRFFQKKLRS